MAQIVFSELAEMACNTPAVLKDEWVFLERESPGRKWVKERGMILRNQSRVILYWSTQAVLCVCVRLNEHVCMHNSWILIRSTIKLWLEMICAKAVVDPKNEQCVCHRLCILILFYVSSKKKRLLIFGPTICFYTGMKVNFPYICVSIWFFFFLNQVHTFFP